MVLMSAACRSSIDKVMAERDDPRHRVSVRANEVVAEFPSAEDYVCLTPDLARCWAEVLTKAADAADMLARIGLADQH